MTTDVNPKKPIDHVFYAHPVIPEDVMGEALKEETNTFSFPYGVTELKQWSFDGILIRHTKNNFNDCYCFENKNLINAVGLEFNLKGNYEIHHMNHVYMVKSRQHNIIYSPGVHNTFNNRDLLGETFKIYFLPDVFLRITKDGNDTLKRFADSISNGRADVMAKVSPILNPELFRAIQEIIHCRFTGGLRKVFLLSKCMEILVMQAESFDKSEQKHRRQLRKTDADSILSAKDYIIENFDNPPSLSELSRIVGINEYKLKRGFKEQFRNTVFGFLSDYRLEKARKALLNSQKSISEIAYELGYSSPQHFSATFKKKFGVAPKEIKT